MNVMSENQQEPRDRPQRKGLDLDSDTPAAPDEPDSFEEMQKASRRGGFVRKAGTAFHDFLVSSRGAGERARDPSVEAAGSPSTTADDLAIRRAKSVSTQRMIVPEGVIIEGSMTSGSETEISGRVDGDVTVEGRLHLGASALISGNVRASSCKVEGLVEGKMECSQDLEVGRTGRLNADALAGKQVMVAGQIFGNVSCGGRARLASTSKVQGNIHTRRLVIEEGAVFNGSCAMRTPAQRKGA